MPHLAATLCLITLCPIVSGLFENGAALTDSRDCRLCKKLRFCSGFKNHMAADCEGDDEEEDAEDKWEEYQGGTCNSAAYKQYVCVRKMDPCNKQGQVISICKGTCVQAKTTCEKKGPATCEGLPTENCWSAPFDTCSEKKCSAEHRYGLCSNLADTRALRCDGEHAAQMEMDSLVAHSHEQGRNGLGGSRACSPEFLKTYVCHAAMRPCTGDGVAQNVCYTDCYRYQRHCLKQSDAVATKRCGTHTDFYCDPVSIYLAKGIEVYVTHDESSYSHNVLITLVMSLCLLQILVLKVLQRASPPPASSLSSHNARNYAPSG